MRSSASHFTTVNTVSGFRSSKVEEPINRNSTVRCKHPVENPIVFTLLKSLKECSRRQDLEKGRLVHSQAIELNLLSNIYLANSLINMYAKCHCMGNARQVFDALVRSGTATSVSWNCLIWGYIDNGECELALQLFDSVEFPDGKTFVAAVTACAALATKDDPKWLEKGKAIHLRATVNQLCDSFVECSLIRMYSRCGNMKEARNVYDKMVHQDVAAWSALLHGYVENSKSEVALELFESEVMKGRKGGGLVLDSRAYVAALSACSTLACSSSSFVQEKGEKIYVAAVVNRCCDIFVETAAIRFYSNCGNMIFARSVFDKMARRDVVAWNAALQGYVKNGQSSKALELFDAMALECLPDERSFVLAVIACAALAGEDFEKSKWLKRGKSIHQQAVMKRCFSTCLGVSLITMYSRCGDMLQARTVFNEMAERDVTSWNALLQGYVENGDYEQVLELFDCSCFPDVRSYAAALTACAALAARNDKYKVLLKGKALHFGALLSDSYDTFVETALVNMYAKCGEMVRAQIVSDSMPRQDVVSWTCLAQGYVDNAQSDRALELIAEMYFRGFSPNSATLLAALTACGNLRALQSGKLFHREILKRGLESDILLANSLVDLYAKSGRVEVAEHLFTSCGATNVVTWNALMNAYSVDGDPKHVLTLFDMMNEAEVFPDEISFVHVLTACGHAGLTDQGKKRFDGMSSRYKLCPNIVHYNCVIDLLARAGLIDEAMRMFEDGCVKPNAVTWRILLAASQNLKNVSLGHLASESLLALEERSDAAYVLMANSLT